MKRLVILLLLLPACVAAAADVVTVAPPEDETVLLHNPDMGWVLYENYPIDPDPHGSSTLLTLPDEAWPMVDEVAMMFSWADVERRAGEYDFARVDFAYDHWRKRGKRIQLRLSTESLLWWARRSPPAGTGVPDYLLAHLPPDKKQTRTAEGIDYVVVDAREPYYLERLNQFLEAVEKHYGKDRPVTLIDLRGFGLWGEWHSGYKYATLADRHAALVDVIDCWSRALPSHYLALSYSHDPDGPMELYGGPSKHYDPASAKNYDEFLRYSAFDHAMTRPNVTLRRDGVGGAVFSNQRKLCNDAFATLSKGPMVCEFLGGYGQAKKAGPKWLAWMIDDALSLHPNYVNLLGWQGGDALAFCREQPALVERGLRTMGYRLVPIEVKYPRTIQSAQEFSMASTWINRGVGRAMRDYHLKVTLGAAACDAGSLQTSRWIAGAKYETTSAVTFNNVTPGEYELHLGLVDTESGDAIHLPLKGSTTNGTYFIGNVTVTPGQ